MASARDRRGGRPDLGGRDRLFSAGAARAGPGCLAVLPGADGRVSGAGGQLARPGPPVGLTGSAAPDIKGSIRPEDVERQLRIALRTAEKGDSARAVALLDRVLEVEPINREALLGRASIALEQSRRATSPAERAAALEKAGSFIRAVRRAYEQSNNRELAVFAAVLYEEVKLNAREGRLDRAVAILKEAYEAGFDAFDRVEHDEDLAKLRSSPGYHALLKSIDAANLAKSRGRVKNYLDHPLDFAFDFNVKDLDGKPLSLGQFKGKVVVVNIWGTWCEPCRKAIPGLIQLYYRHRRRGLEIVGLDYEQNAPDAETARKYVKQVVQQMNIPYRIAMGERRAPREDPEFPRVSHHAPDRSRGEGPAARHRERRRGARRARRLHRSPAGRVGERGGCPDPCPCQGGNDPCR